MPAGGCPREALPLSPYLVDVVAIGTLDDEPELMSVGAAEPEAPMEVPLPVVDPVVEPVVEPMPLLPLAVVSVLPVLGVVPSEPEPVVLPVVVLVSAGGVVVDGVVLEVGDEVVLLLDELAASSFLPHALRVSAAIRARAAACEMGDLIIRNSLGFRSGR